MKTCPRCGASFSDDLAYCLNDGAALAVADGEQETVIAARPVPPPQSRSGASIILWLLAAVVMVLLIAVVAIAAWLIGRRGVTTVENRPAATATPTPSPQSTADPNANIIAENERLRRQLDEQKKANISPPLPPSPPSGPGQLVYVPHPVGNIRTGPGTGYPVLCRVTNTAPFRVAGSSGIRDENGYWFYTDACGGTGYIHSSQFRYTR